MNMNGCLSLAGDDVYFEVVGAPDAPAVVLGHGAGGNHAIWFQQVPVFEREHRVITWDQRGFGNSTNRNGLASPGTATNDLLAIGRGQRETRCWFFAGPGPHSRR